jgi:uncharacterized protein YecT (DUF1311 family)
MIAGTAYANADRCSGASPHAEQRGCLESMFRETEERLVQAEKSTVAKITVWDEDLDYRTKSRKALSASNLAFRKYRASQCEFAWSLAAGGNGATDMRLSCAIELTEGRIRQLDAYAAGLERR